MADTKFKVGDRVRITALAGADSSYGLKVGDIGQITRKGINPGVWLVDFEASNGRGMFERQMAIITAAKPPKPALPPKFILQYELDADPFEFFPTEKEARKRIAELGERTDLKRDSIRLIEIRKIRTVKLGTKITISK